MRDKTTQRNRAGYIGAAPSKEAPHQERYSLKSTYYWGDVSFTLTQPNPTEDESKLLLLKIVEQAIRDYVNLSRIRSPAEEWAFQTAEAFLFDEDYLINYGEANYSLEQLLSILGLDAEWIKRKATELREQRERRTQPTAPLADDASSKEE